MLSIVFGLILLGNTLVAVATLPWVLGVMGILFGFLAIVMAFVVRGRQKEEAEMLRRRKPPRYAATTGAAQHAAGYPTAGRRPRRMQASRHGRGWGELRWDGRCSRCSSAGAAASQAAARPG